MLRHRLFLVGLFLALSFTAGCDLSTGLLAPVPLLSQDQIEGTIAAAIAATQAQFTPTPSASATPVASRSSTPTRSPTPSNTASLTPVETVTFTLTPAGSLTPIPDKLLITVSVETHCRAGPGKGYARLSALPAGESAQILARDPTGRYWYIPNPENPSGRCWVWDEYATFNADTSYVPVMTSAPPPSETPRPTATIDAVRRVQAGPSGREIIYERPDTGFNSVGFVYDGEYVTLLPKPLNPRGRPYARHKEFSYMVSSHGLTGWVRLLSDGTTGFLVLVKPEEWVPFGKRHAEPSD